MLGQRVAMAAEVVEAVEDNLPAIKVDDLPVIEVSPPEVNGFRRWFKRRAR